MDIYLTKTTSLHRVLLLVDLGTGLQSSDEQLLDFLCEKTIMVNLVLTKSDKVKPKILLSEAEKIVTMVQKKGLVISMSPIVHMVSCLSGYGVHELQCGIA